MVAGNTDTVKTAMTAVLNAVKGANTEIDNKVSAYYQQKKGTTNDNGNKK